MRLTYHNIDRALRIGCAYLNINPLDVIVDIYRDSSDDAVGYCSGDADEAHIAINQSTKGNDWVEILAHELVHAKQYLEGELEDGGPMVHYWQGNKIVTVKELFDYDAYRQLPWEREAFSKQKEIMEYIYDQLA